MQFSATAAEAKFYLTASLSSIQSTDEKYCPKKPFILCKIARCMKGVDSDKASELVQQIFAKPIDKYEAWKTAKVIHLLSKDFINSCQDFINSLEDSYEARKALSSYLKEYDSQNTLLTQSCRDKLASWGQDRPSPKAAKNLVTKPKQEHDFNKTDRESVSLHLTNLASNAKSSPEDTRRQLPAILKMVENLPEYEDLGWEPGRGNKRDARVYHISDNVNKLLALVQIYFDVGASSEAQMLKKHRMLDCEHNVENHVRFNLMEANYLGKSDPAQAEKLYYEAWMLAKSVNSENQSWDHIDLKIANAMVSLNPYKAFEIAKSSNNLFEKNGIFLKCIKATTKTDHQFAKRCLDEIGNDTWSADYKSRAYLILFANL